MKQCVLVLALLAIAPLSLADGAGGTEEAAPAKRCLSLSRIKSTRVLDDQTILFMMRGKPDYKNTLPYRCPGLGFYRSFGYGTGINSICDLDIITVLESGRRGASCGLGQFVEYVPEEDAAEPAEDEEGGSE